PNYVPALLTKGRLQWSGGNRTEALRILDDAAKTASGHPAAYGDMAEAYRRMRRYKKAVDVIENALSASSDDAEFIRTKAYALESLGKRKEALRTIQEADPEGTNPLLQADTAYLKISQDQFEE